MSRTRFWTILIGTEPTSFRAAEKETLIPTLRQLQRRHPESVLKWFERGQLFDSPEEAAEALSRSAPGSQERRPRGWRPGGEHRDPRERFKLSRDEKRRRFKARQQHGYPAGPVRRPEDQTPKRPRGDDWGGARGRPPSTGFQGPRSDRPPAGQPRGDRDRWQDRPPRDDRRPPANRPPAGQPRGDRDRWQDRPPRNDRGRGGAGPDRGSGGGRREGPKQRPFERKGPGSGARNRPPRPPRSGGPGKPRKE